jgi:hypothetical protein
VAAGCTGDEEAETPPIEEATAGPWGSPRDAEHAAALMPEDKRPERIVEFFLFGGLAPWDTVYVVPEHGDPEQGGPYAMQQWWQFQFGPDNVQDHFNRCGGGSRDLYEPFATDALGKTVNLGPFVYPLRDRPDLLRRMRILVMGHDQLSHQAAVPLALCGQLRSSPRLASTGAHIERYFQDRVGNQRPHAWQIIPGLPDLGTFSADSANSIGLHRPSARPLQVRFNGDGLDLEALRRPAFGSRRTAVDAAVERYLQAYEARYRHGDGRLRSAGLDDYAAARAALGRSDAILALLNDTVASGSQGMECGETSAADYTTMGLRLAAHLATRPEGAPRYINAVDGGLFPATAGAAYDTHVNHVVESSTNVVHFFSEFASRINEPGEDDPDKLDLDRDLVLVTTEFGRDPTATGTGTEHWPGGYAVLAFGGPIDEERSGVVGAIGEDGLASESVTPAEFRASLLLAMGIWPFSTESFAVGDVREGVTELDAAVWLKERIWGYST